MKKLLALLLCALLVLPAAMAEEAKREVRTSGDFKYAVLED